MLLLSLARLALAAPPEEALSGQYLVILASQRNTDEKVAAVEVLAANPELAGGVRTLSSSHFKNLMPCYTVTIGGASADRAEAKALGAKLKAAGVDNYVKNAGEYVGASAVIDGWCNRAAAETDLRQAEVTGGRTWLGVDFPPGTFDDLLAKAPPPRALSGAYDAWSQPLTTRNSVDLAVGSTVTLADLSSGREARCALVGFSALTLGTPHFGALQEEGGPKRPACGVPAPYAELDCAVDAGGVWIRADGHALGALAADGSAKAKPDALDASPDWTAPPEGNSRELKATRYAGGYLLVEGHVFDEMGICGGDDYTVASLLDRKGEAVLGPVRIDAGQVLGVARVDGKLVLVVQSFPSVVELVGPDGDRTTLRDVAYCDCPC